VRGEAEEQRNGGRRARTIRFNPSTPLILFAFVFFRRDDAIFNPVSVKHDRAEVEEKQAETPSG
jgi:hypothetical protein